MVRTDETCHLEVKGEDLHLNIDDLLPTCMVTEETAVERTTKSVRKNKINLAGHISLYGINCDNSDTNSNSYSTSNESSSSCCSSNESSNSNGSCCNNDNSSNESSITQNSNSNLQNNTTNLMQERCSISSINSIRHIDSSISDDNRCMSKIRMVVLGAHGVGKSATVVRFLTQRFIGEYRSAVDIVYRRALRHGNRHQVLEIVDISTPPREFFLPNTTSLLSADCVLVLYSVADHASLETATEILETIVNNNDPRWRPPVTLLGNKLDLADFRQVSRGEGEATASKFNCAFSEVSAAESSEDIVPVFLHLIHRVNANASIIDCFRNSSDCTSLCNLQADISSASSSPVCKHIDGKATAQNAPKHLSPPSPSTSRSSSFGRQNSLLQCGERIRSRLERNSSRNQSSSNSKGLFCSQRCRSFDEALNFCQMEVYESSALDQPKSCISDSKFKCGNSNSKKISKPQIPTGRSKNKKLRIKSPTKSSEMRLSRNDDMFPLAKKCFSQQELSQNEPANRNETNTINGNQSSKLSIRDYLSKSVDQNLQKINNQTEKESSQKSSSEGKLLTVLQRGRSFIREAKDKHWKDRDLRLSIRNLSSRNSDYSKTDKSVNSLKGFMSIPTSRTGRPRTLPTGGKTWLTRSEGDDDRIGLLELIRMTRASSVSGKIGNSSSPVGSSALRAHSPAEDTSPIHSPSPTPQPKGGALMFDADDKASVSINLENKDDRHRKFSVISRTLGSFLSRSSMPDLPRATANLYDRFVKKPIQKRSA